ncbi:hypothetical protein BH09BAC1_BH09BAC1_03230 [soil metagenome]
MPINWFIGLLDSDRWMPRWSCGRWEEWEGWLYIISDLAIALAYFAIPVLIAAFILKRRTELPFLKIFWLFFFFIFLCGATHFIDAIIFWKPVYQLSAFVRFATAVVSWGTVVAIIYYLPQALKLKTPVQFEHELKQRVKVEQELEQKYLELEAAQLIAKVGTFKSLSSDPELQVSKYFYEIFGEDTSNALTATKLQENVHPDDQNTVKDTLQVMTEKGGKYELLYRYFKPDCKMIFIHSRAEAIYDEDGKPIGFQGFLQDVTEVKTIENALKRRAIELESINKELELFAYAASHDLQEPLRKLRAFGDRLNQKYADKLDDQGRDYLSRMDSASTRMQILIDDLLAYSRLSRNKDEMQPIDLNVLIEEVLSDLEQVITEKGINIERDNLPTVIAVPGQLRQLFQNLLSNAFKFTKEGVAPKVTISCTTAKGRDLVWKDDLETLSKYYVIVVKDNGIGFEQQYAEKIFSMFQRLHGRSDYPGTGIGLALCKKIVENHEGIIRATGTENEGAIFTIVLPVRKN